MVSYKNISYAFKHYCGWKGERLPSSCKMFPCFCPGHFNGLWQWEKKQHLMSLCSLQSLLNCFYLSFSPSIKSQIPSVRFCSRSSSSAPPSPSSETSLGYSWKVLGDKWTGFSLRTREGNLGKSYPPVWFIVKKNVGLWHSTKQLK